MSTATFPNREALILAPLRVAHDLHFAYQCHVCFTLYRFLHEFDQRFDVMRRRPAFVDNEIGVQRRYLRAAYALAFESAFLDESGRIVARRITEYRARVGFAEWLRGDALRQQLLDLLARRIAVASRKSEPGGNEKLVIGLYREDAAVTDRIFVRLANVQPARAVDGSHPGNRAPGLCSVAACIHCQRATHRAGYAGEKLRALEVTQRRETRNFRTGNARLRVDLCVTSTLLKKQAREQAMRKYNGTAKTPIADQQIAAKTDKENRFVLREPAEKYAEIVKNMARQKAIILGQFTRYQLAPNDKGYKLQTAVDWMRAKLKVPVLANLPFGHVPTKVVLPFGAGVKLLVEGRDALLYWGHGRGGESRPRLAASG